MNSALVVLLLLILGGVLVALYLSGHPIRFDDLPDDDEPLLGPADVLANQRATMRCVGAERVIDELELVAVSLDGLSDVEVLPPAGPTPGAREAAEGWGGYSTGEIDARAGRSPALSNPRYLAGYRTGRNAQADLSRRRSARATEERPFARVDSAVVCNCGHDLADHLPSDKGCFKCPCERYVEAPASQRRLLI